MDDTTTTDALLKQIKAITTVYPARSVSKARMLEMVTVIDRERVLMTIEAATLTAERDWYRAGLHGISKGHYADPAEHAAGVLKWIGDDTPNPVDRLRETVAALVTAATYAVDCWGEPEQDWCRSDMETAMKEVRAALALAAASHADNGAAVDGGQITEATK